VLLCLVLIQWIEADLGKGRREELDDDVGREVSKKLRDVIEREMTNEKAKL
jgi:hypothetical protein